MKGRLWASKDVMIKGGWVLLLVVIIAGVSILMSLQAYGTAVIAGLVGAFVYDAILTITNRLRG